MDRVHRLGQEREVHVTRFITRGTVEQRMLELQESKRADCQAVLGGADDEGAPAAGGAGGRRDARERARKLRLKDLQHYFDGYDD